ncbi:MAG TPA: hypothetical protein VLI45_03120, partial [Acidobacteriaceae bacterium]|nr:hypothetical protein [Acidobacteriaceae bacterium]
MRFGRRMGWRGIAGAVLCVAVAMMQGQATHKKHARTTAKKSASAKSHTSAAAKGHAKTRHRTAAAHGKEAKRRHVRRRQIRVEETAQSRRLHTAFAASTQLRPMAQQLVATRSAAAYEGVRHYAEAHPGDAAAAAQLALGHAYMLDHKYPEAQAAFAQAKQIADVLDDYAVYLGAQAALHAGKPADAGALLAHFAEQYPDSLFVTEAPVL